MKKWIKGDLHVHSHCCGDGTLPVVEIVERSREFCDFLAISGHCREPEFFRAEAQYAEVAAARKKFDIPIFNTGEIEFPVERHVMMITTPGNREFELLRSLVPRFCRRAGAVGIDTAMEELAFVEKNWGDQCFMVFNHPNAPDVSLENLLRLAQSPVFKVLACVDRGERRAPQTWDVGGEWDQLLCRGCRISARCGSDFHRHFTDGGHDYYPGEFVQDVLLVEKNDYPEIFAAYRRGDFYCRCGENIENPEFSAQIIDGKTRLHLAFDAVADLEFVEIISDGIVVMEFRDFDEKFCFDGFLPRGKYFRVRGKAVNQKRKYSDGVFEPVFLLNPIYF